MDREVSIVLSVERRNYRKVAQEWYGLTDEQMKGMDVHHNPAQQEGGRNIPEHLYVYHNTLHSAVHENDSALWSRVGSMKAHSEKDEHGRSILGVENSKRLNLERDELGRSKNAVKGAIQAHKTKDDKGRSVNAVKGSEKSNKPKDEFGRSIASLRGAVSLHSVKWEDPEHPELGRKPPGVLARMQIARGLPHGPKNRRKVG